MALYDYICHKCGHLEEDVFGSTAQQTVTCPKCGWTMAWKPFVRTQSTKAPFFCEQAGRKFHNYHDLDRWAKENGKSIVPTKEYESKHMKRVSTAERFAKTTATDKTVREEVKKVHSRLKQGYRFHPETKAEYKKAHKE